MGKFLNKDLLYPLLEVKEGKRILGSGNTANFVLPSSERIPFSVPSTFTEESIEKLLAYRVIENTTREIMKVKSPDFLGDSQWKFKADKVITAKMLDVQWISKFKKSEVVLSPGDSLEVDLKTIKKYDADMNLTNESYEVEKVVKIHRERDINPPLF